MAKTNLTSLNKILPNLTANKNTKRRHVTDHNRNDAIADALSKCENAADIAALGMKFGLTEQEVKTRAKSAPNFGQFRMVIGNRIRGVVRRISKAKKEGKKLTPAEAAYPKAATAKKVTKKAIKIADKRIKKSSKKSAKKSKRNG